MGLSASQARFLGLTARKTNVEFEGQQINQQRTTLANQSANYYNDLLGMSVPTPPSVDSFTKTVYTFTDGALTNQITAMIAKGNGNYKVSYLQQYEDDFTPVAAGMAVVTKSTVSGTDVYSVGNTQLRNIGDKITYTITHSDTSTTIVTAELDSGGNLVYKDNNNQPVTLQSGDKIKLDSQDEYLKTLTPEQIIKLQTEEADYKTLLNSKYGTPTNGWAVRYLENTSSGVYEPMFYNMDQVKSAQYDTGTGISKSSIHAYKMGSATNTTEIKGVDARVEQDSTGRYINITLNPGQTDETTYSLTTSTITDQDAYNDAMNQYEYDKQQYDQAINEINAKIEIIQAQDKNLELRLKQLDTEQDAISNEMDAVQKVIEKNSESTFKTFG